jgi:23S rRNA (guanine745-N1)-methyltransferase
VSLLLRCTVRRCGESLAAVDDRLVCPRGHSFDRAREGYWNLLQPQDRRSPEAGDRGVALAARRRWLSRGFADGLAKALAEAIDEAGLPPGSAAVDVGCGEGTLTARLFAERGHDVCGVDLSAAGIAMAARLEPRFTWVVANADRGLPLADASIDLAVSVFGRRPVAELHRVLRVGGVVVAVLPAEDDLIELRAAAQGEAARRDRLSPALAELAPWFDVSRRSGWRHRAHHDRDALEDALAMSYRGARGSERERLAGLTGLDVTVAADILALVSRGGVR